jgi:hypothetical protein
VLDDEIEQREARSHHFMSDAVSREYGDLKFTHVESSAASKNVASVFSLGFTFSISGLWFVAFRRAPADHPRTANR